MSADDAAVILAVAAAIGIAYIWRPKRSANTPPARVPADDFDIDLICNNSEAAANAMLAGDNDEAIALCLRSIEAQERWYASGDPVVIVDPGFYTKAAHCYQRLGMHEQATAMLLRYVKQCAARGLAPQEYVITLHAEAIEKRHDAARTDRPPPARRQRKSATK